jgi:NAD(P)H-hydrate epimerase
MPVSRLLYSAAQVRAIDAYAIAHGTEGYTLMKRAGEAALRVLRTRWPRALSVNVIAGGGNNGGDGYTLARFAQAAGLNACVLAVVPPEQLKGDARRAHDDYCAAGGKLVPYSRERLTQAEVIADALLGTGLTQTVRPPIAEVIEAVNRAGRPVLALDLPSGLNSDTGEVMGAAVRATCSISFVALKTGLFLGAGPEYVGQLQFDDLDVLMPLEAEGEFHPRLERLTESDIRRALPPRHHAANKGDFGRVLILGGGAGMPGAARLAGEACLRVGAGLVSVATWPANLLAISAGRPELIVHGVETPPDLMPLLQAADVVAVGPGFGRSSWSRALLERALASERPLVLDADALNLLAESNGRAPARAILTPHPGEAGRLLGSSAAAVQADRLGALQALTARHAGAVVVLKGAGTLIGQHRGGSDDDPIPALCEYGNPAMASGGTGDVLTGAIAGILAQCRDPWLAARAGVVAHALAGDELARERERGLLALELAEALTRWVNLK